MIDQLDQYYTFLSRYLDKKCNTNDWLILHLVTTLQCQVARLGTFSCSVDKGVWLKRTMCLTQCPSYVRVMSENRVDKLLKD